MLSFYALFYKELLRVWNGGIQAVLAPVLSTLLYLFIFSSMLEQQTEIYPGVRYTAFLVPGLVMMAVLQITYGNSSTSLSASKVTGNLVFVLLSPVTYWEFFLAYVLAAMVRGLVVGVGVYLAALWFAQPPTQFPLWIILFALLGSALLGSLGVLVGILAENFDQLGGYGNFIVTPLTFLSGAFYSIHSLPSFWQEVSRLNPFFYIIDGFRYGFFGVSDISPWLGLAVVSGCLLALAGFTLALLKSGYKLRL